MPGIESSLSKAAARVAGHFVSNTRKDAQVRRLRDSARPLMAEETAAGLLDDLSASEAAGVARYMASPEFESVVMNAVIARMHRTAKKREEHASAVREQLRQGLRLATGLPGERLLGLTDVVLDGVQAAAGPTAQRSDLVPEALVAQGHLTALAARTGALLSRITDEAAMHEDFLDMRSQVSQLHAELRMPQSAKARSVPWDSLYVAPAVHHESREDLTVDLDELTEPGRRHVILGDPGAGKSTLAEKLAHDLAADPTGTVVPLLVVLRHFSAALETGERTLAEHLVTVSRDPYNVTLTPDAVDYLLMNGRAVVILDGLDELSDVALRRRVADLVKGFVLRHPLVPVVATSRRVGYAEAPLDPSLFRTCALAPFDRAKAETYARRWFALDEGTPEAERSRLATAFLNESETIEDLRSSPLLLSVLCAMYASDHYIPGNRGEVYERCALMVFEQWDRMRGISRKLGFEGRVRGSVQHLAWTLFTEHTVPEQPRRRVLRIVEDHLVGKGFDEDQAAEVAAEFLDYCAGRAWILAEVGSTPTEPIFGFAHRTFLEYFAAECLVRRAKTPEVVWAELADRVRHSQWEVVSQLAVQLLERNVEDGGDTLLGLALDDLDAATESRERDALVAFAARSLGDVVLSPDMVEQIVDVCVDRALAYGEADRMQMLPSGADFAALEASDFPLHAAMYRCLPDNLPFVHRRLEIRLGELLEAENGVAFLLVSHLDRRMRNENDARAEVWSALKRELQERHGEVFERWRARSPWGRAGDDAAVHEVLDHHGLLPFFTTDVVMSGAGYPWVAYLLIDMDSDPEERRRLPKAVARELRDSLIGRPTPWLPAQRRPGDILPFPIAPIEAAFRDADGEDLATFLVFFLPYLECDERSAREGVAKWLLTSRTTHARTEDVDGHLADYGVPEHVREFLVRWVRRQIFVVEPAN
ncbi:NACHT domain-containing protein [Actinoplanes sp. LDG1-06]|uniref:NACHT domain-containing protein n=1 Tax=Paractinoplanes ovalisporus TaxID=2810368 RepID=A0ABS2AK33_9ACTN|nr:NACHT domain-containing protein [Actinoplanes ovalisporus]MBM2620207.1 NACHT domain-containing protein [Actinoplanes ovalisporus]